MARVKDILLVVLGCVVLTSVGSAVRAADKAAAPNTLTDAEKKAGWKLLFDGRSADAWRAYRGKGLPPEWKVAGGELQLHDKGGKLATGIVTRDQFADFELSLEWRIARNGNCGVLYRVNEAHAPPHDSGPEMQILDDDRYPAPKNPPERRAAACYDLYAPSAKVDVVPGKWNAVRIVARGNHVEHWFNGVKVVDYELDSPDWRARVARSKFAKSPFYGKESRGHILLQQHGHEVAFRNIKIRELD
jgi:hypothetical protein